MTGWVALLRAVNVGGTGKLRMADLRAVAENAGLVNVRTLIASGNLLFDSDRDEAGIRAVLGPALERHCGRTVPIAIRSAPAMAAVLAANPFPDGAPNRTVAIFLDAAPPADTLDRITGRGDERIALVAREIWVDYGGAMRDSRLRIPAADAGTARNLNTVARLVAMSNAPTIP